MSGDGNALKEIGQGSGAGAGTNTSGFSALLSGLRDFDGSFSDLGGVFWFWSSTESSPGGSQAYLMYLLGYTSIIYLDDYHKVYGYSVRCIKD